MNSELKNNFLTLWKKYFGNADLPMKRFEKMIGFMEESFLITDTWTVIRKRL